MWTPTLVLIAITTLAACVTLGGGLYEFLVVDPSWPKRPGIIQPRNGGVSRARFWIPAHTLFEVLLIVTLVVAWGDADVRVALLVALVSHAVMRVWSLVDFVPKAVAFEKADPADRRRGCRGPLDPPQPVAPAAGPDHVCGDARLAALGRSTGRTPGASFADVEDPSTADARLLRPRSRLRSCARCWPASSQAAR